MLNLKRHKRFKKDLQRANLTDKQFEKLIKYISLLLKGESLPPEARDHPLVGDWKDFIEFHLGGDLLVIYKIDGNNLILTRIGTHNKLFK